MNELDCPYCDAMVPVEADFADLGKPFPCPHCGKSVCLGYESLYDEDTQEAEGWFCLEGAEP